MWMLIITYLLFHGDYAETKILKLSYQSQQQCYKLRDQLNNVQELYARCVQLDAEAI